MTTIAGVSLAYCGANSTPETWENYSECELLLALTEVAIAID